MSPVTRSSVKNSKQQNPANMNKEEENEVFGGGEAHVSAPGGSQSNTVQQSLRRSESVLSVRSNSSNRSLENIVRDAERRRKREQVELDKLKRDIEDKKKLRDIEDKEKLLNLDLEEEIERARDEALSEVGSVRGEPVSPPRSPGPHNGHEDFDNMSVRSFVREFDESAPPGRPVSPLGQEAEHPRPRRDERVEEVNVSYRRCAVLQREEDNQLHRRHPEDRPDQRDRRRERTPERRPWNSRELEQPRYGEMMRPQPRYPQQGLQSDVGALMARHTFGKELPAFWGEPEEWNTFISEFATSTEQCQFTEAENVCRLRKCLKGKAKEAVQSMLMVGSRLDDIMRTLKMRFGQPKMLMRILVDRLKQVPAPDGRSGESLVDFALAIQNLAVTADSMNMPEYLNNPQLMEDLVKKLPWSLRLAWGSHLEDGAYEDILELSKWLEKKSAAAVRVSVSVDDPRKKFHDGRKQDKSFVAVEDKGCAAGCASGHPLQKCEKFSKMKKDDRWKLVRSKGLCLSCLRGGHSIANCKFQKRCGVTGCGNRHNSLLHEERWNQAAKPERPGPSQQDRGAQWNFQRGPSHTDHNGHGRERRERHFGGFNSHSQERVAPPLESRNGINQERSDYRAGPSSGHMDHFDRLEQRRGPPTSSDFNACSVDQKEAEVLLRVVPVKVRGTRGWVDTYAMCDEGSTLTLMEESLAQDLGLEGEETQLNLAWLDGANNALPSSRVSVWISGSDQVEHKLDNVRTVQTLNLPVQTIKTETLQARWPHLREAPLKTFLDAKPRILLGIDNGDLTMPRRIVEGPKNAPVATLTKLGWILQGQNKYPGLVEQHSSFLVQTMTDDEKMHQLMKAQFHLDSMGLVSSKKPPRSKSDKRAEVIMEDTSRRVEDGWETAMLWKDDDVKLPESKRAAYRRLMTLENQMDKDPELGNMYCSKIEEYIEKGFCRKLSYEEAAKDNGRLWYLPHFGRTNPNKPGKLRLVFDCAARTNGMGLNDALLQGPDLMTPLISVLAKFRQKEVAFCGDIRDMFHRIKIRQEDLPSLRFLWRGKMRNKPPDVYTMNVMVFGAVSSPYQAQWIKNRNAAEFEEEFGDAAKAVVDRHYVDDYLDSVETPAAAIQKIKEVREIHRRGGFEIRNWLCNRKEVLDAVQPESEQLVPSNLEAALEITDTEELERVLGLYWDPKTDDFRFKRRFRTVGDDVLSGDKTPTKREVLKLVMCIFDPLGFVSHLCVRAKILIQDIWRLGLGWDEKLPPGLQEKWNSFRTQLDGLCEVRIPRCYSPSISQAEDVQLHVFCDASEQAFCAVAYLRVTVNGAVDINIVVGKTRVSPLRPVSIPRLELQAALVGARLVARVKEDHEVPIHATVLWTDSRNVLCWLRAEDPRRFKPYVAHRIGEILEHTDVSSWRWVPTDLNVADDGTRDVTPTEMSCESRWFKGPNFLLLTDAEWPVETSRIEKATVKDLEMKKDFSLVITEVEYPDVDYASSWREMVRTEAVRASGEDGLSVDSVRAAEKTLLKKCQWESFKEEVSYLSRGQRIPKRSRLLKLSPYLDGAGMMRIRSRVEHSPAMSEDARAPIILDPKHPITKRIVDHYHLLFKHQGQELVGNELRQKYWILGVRGAVRGAWRRCEDCQMTHAKPAQAQMAPLPDFRVTRVKRPFTNVGVDYFGPLEVMHMRKKLKRYGLIFVCMNTRAIHLEITHSLDTDSTLMAIERFMNRRGTPDVIWSDNGRSFIGANNEMKKALKETTEELQKKLVQQGITWNFIPPLSPHFGGSWERLIRSVKTTMHAILKGRTPTDEMLLSVMSDAESTVNSRPLTFVSSDAGDVEAITPNCFLMGTTSVLQQPGKFSDDDLTHRRRWKICQVLADHFWKRWVKEFLPSLAARQKWNLEQRCINVGDRVIIVDGSMPRNIWMTGAVVKVFPGKDGQVRVADVETQNGIFRRPIVKLCRIEVDAEDSDTNYVVSREGV